MHNVIWDMGGTLVDTYPEVDRALAGVVWPGGSDSAHLAEVRELRTRSIAHAIDILSTRYGVDPVLFHRAYSDLKRRWRTTPAPLMDGARELMGAVHDVGGLNLVATHRDRTSAEALLAALHVEVDDLVCTSDGWARKPDPQMYLVLMERHGLSRRAGWRPRCSWNREYQFRSFTACTRWSSPRCVSYCHWSDELPDRTHRARPLRETRA